MEHRIRTANGPETANITPGKAIKLHCKECQGWEGNAKDCDGLGNYPGGTCGLFPYRLGRGRPKLAEIQWYCIWCQSGGKARTLKVLTRVRECADTHCCLWPYRQAKNPSMRGRDTSAAREALAARKERG